MKIAGIIIIVFGALSMLGILLKGGNLIGPIFWIALGWFLLYRANKKDAVKSQNEELPNYPQK